MKLEWIVCSCKIAGRDPFDEITVDMVEGFDGPKFAVRNGCRCLGKDGKWHYEPRPSSRSDEFLSVCRWKCPEDARKAAEQYLKQLNEQNNE